MTKKIILGNWKMCLLQQDAVALAKAVAACNAPAHAEIAVFPSAPFLLPVSAALQGSSVALGAQDCSPDAVGAFTGDVSAAMLRDAGCGYVIVGHSERRTLHQESSALVKAKAEAALQAGLTAVICVGESIEQRESGKYLAVIEAQITASLPALSGAGRIIVAYEPVWAIGSGRTPGIEEISEVHKTIASELTYATSGARAAILYGGSVKAANAREIMAGECVDGVLVGGASLKADEFCAIIAAA